MRPAPGWQPDLRASLLLALISAVILFYSFLGLLHKPPTQDAAALMSLSLVSLPLAPVRSHARKSTPKIAPPALTSAPPHREPLSPAIDLATLQQQVDAAVRETTRSSGAFLLPPDPIQSDLARALQRQPKPGTLGQGESYRSGYGQAIVKSGDNCAAQQEVQVTPGGAKATVAFMVPCPGGYQPSMADALAEWAKKVAKKNLPPP